MHDLAETYRASSEDKAEVEQLLHFVGAETFSGCVVMSATTSQNMKEEDAGENRYYQLDQQEP